MNLIIRNATRDDFDTVHTFDVEMFRLHRIAQPSHFQEADPFSQADYDSWLENGSIILIAELDGEPVGAISSSLPKRINSHPSVRKHKLYHTSLLFVVEKYRKQGIGKALYEETRRRVKEKDAEGLSFNVWAFNKDAIGFYERLGAKCVSMRF